ncbi:hypothetical protein S7711_10537 [Stachybotrys chartarum IBT 7711]|uniref:Uncharacterized protein n=1 Tax=Stachybotrys chartarum (strain CBS 109288 / IBT 7711) TaxID=1280523 RepID=A0A084AVX9_STACB|nr:hypothetical protein S7711_10537 [Stachybotrys chartarum IBT 7711]
MMATKENHISPWQSKALESGRTPLPNAPGERPWLDETSRTKLSAVRIPLPLTYTKGCSVWFLLTTLPLTLDALKQEWSKQKKFDTMARGRQTKPLREAVPVFHGLCLITEDEFADLNCPVGHHGNHRASQVNDITAEEEPSEAANVTEVEVDDLTVQTAPVTKAKMTRIVIRKKTFIATPASKDVDSTPETSVSTPKKGKKRPLPASV